MRMRCEGIDSARGGDGHIPMPLADRDDLG